MRPWVTGGILRFVTHRAPGRLSGKIALITGGTAGIGAATAELFVAEGATVWFTGRNRDKGNALAERLGDAAHYVEADVRSSQDCALAVETAMSQSDRIDTLFNNAGIVPFGTAEETSDEMWADTLATNVTGVFQMCRAVLPAMRASGGGSIVNNASDWGLVGGQGALAYCTSKGAVVQMTKSLALDHARENIRVNAVCPGDTYVDRWAEGSDGDVTTEIEAMAAVIPMGRVADVGEIAEAVLYLCSDLSSYVTGQCLVVDGGNTAGGASTRY